MKGKIQCQYFKKCSWWNIFKTWDDCVHPEKIAAHDGEHGICLWKGKENGACSYFKQKPGINEIDKH